MPIPPRPITSRTSYFPILAGVLGDMQGPRCETLTLPEHDQNCTNLWTLLSRNSGSRQGSTQSRGKVTDTTVARTLDIVLRTGLGSNCEQPERPIVQGNP